MDIHSESKNCLNELVEVLQKLEQKLDFDVTLKDQSKSCYKELQQEYDLIINKLGLLDLKEKQLKTDLNNFIAFLNKISTLLPAGHPNASVCKALRIDIEMHFLKYHLLLRAASDEMWDLLEVRLKHVRSFLNNLENISNDSHFDSNERNCIETANTFLHTFDGLYDFSVEEIENINENFSGEYLLLSDDLLNYFGVEGEYAGADKDDLWNQCKVYKYSIITNGILFATRNYKFGYYARELSEAVEKLAPIATELSKEAKEIIHREKDVSQFLDALGLVIKILGLVVKL